MSLRQINNFFGSIGQVNLQVVLNLKFDLTIVYVDLQAGAEVDRCISTCTY